MNNQFQVTFLMGSGRAETLLVLADTIEGATRLAVGAIPFQWLSVTVEPL